MDFSKSAKTRNIKIYIFFFTNNSFKLIDVQKLDLFFLTMGQI